MFQFEFSFSRALTAAALVLLAVGGGRAAAAVKKLEGRKIGRTRTVAAAAAKKRVRVRRSLPQRSALRRRYRVRPVRKLRDTTSWDRVQHAFGDQNNRIEFSWELEGKNRRIVNYFFQYHVVEEYWQKMDVDERWQRIDEMMDDDGFGAFGDLIRMSDAPDFLSLSADEEMKPGVWEIKSNSFATRPAQLFRRVRWLKKNLAKDDRAGGFHYHVSFGRQRADAFADQIVTFLAQVNEYTYLRMYANDMLGVHADYLSPLATETLDWIKGRILQGASVERESDGSFFAKRAPFGTVALRSRPYGEDRLGFEIRSVNSHIDDAEMIVDQVVRFLDSPKRAMIKFGKRGRAYSVDSVAKVDRLSSETFERFRPRIRRYLSDLEDRIESDGKGPSMGEDLLVRWSVPLVKWEERPNLSPQVKKTIIRARKEFLASLGALVEKHDSGQIGRSLAPNRREQAWVEQATRNFVINTGLHEYL